MIKLSLRLQTISDMIPQSVVADIGADHGKLIISLYENGIISHGFAIENKKGPYDILVKAIEERGIENEIIPMFSDGISELPEIVNTIVIAGMGGNNIINILKSHQEKLSNVKTIVIDAHSCIPKIRHEICQMGFIIADEKIIKEEGVYYEIIKFIRSGVAFYGDNDIEFGPILRKEKNQVFKEKYQERIQQIEDILNSGDIPNSRIEELKNEENKIKGIL